MAPHLGRDLSRRDVTREQIDSLPLCFAEDALFHATFPAIAVDNATERRASPQMGGGLYDCDSPMGEGYSHGIFLAGFSWMLLNRGDQIETTVKDQMVDLMKVFAEYIFLLKLDSGAYRQQVLQRPGQIDRGLMHTTEPTYGLLCAALALEEIDPDLSARCRESALTGVRWLAGQDLGAIKQGPEQMPLDIAALGILAYGLTGETDLLELCSRIVFDWFLGHHDDSQLAPRWGSIPRIELFLRLLDTPIGKKHKQLLEEYLSGKLLEHYTSRAEESVFPVPLPIEAMGWAQPSSSGSYHTGLVRSDDCEWAGRPTAVREHLATRRDVYKARWVLAHGNVTLEA